MNEKGSLRGRGVHVRTLGEGMGTPWLRPFQKVKKF